MLTLRKLKIRRTNILSCLLLFVSGLISAADNSTVGNSLISKSLVENTDTSNQYVLEKIAQAPQLKTANNQWLLLEKAGNNQHYYLANQQGEIYQLDQLDANNTALLLDIKRLTQENSLLKLTAFTLHPNFSLRDQPGYGLFYTAHVEKNNTKQTNRLHEPSIKQQIDFDAVVTEWQLTLGNKIDLTSRREILKVAIPSANNSIKQLSFNPHSTFWDEDFAQLYIAIDQHPSLKEYPLYSGVILRILPKKLPLANYSVPQDNPFLKHAKIAEPIYVLGTGQIKQFIWPDKYSNKILISHQYTTDSRSHNHEIHSVSYAYGGEDWRKQAPDKFLFKKINSSNISSQSLRQSSDQSLRQSSDQSSGQISKPSANSTSPKTPIIYTNLLTYHGEDVPTLRNKLLFLSQENQQWQLSSLSSNKKTASLTDNIDPQNMPAIAVEWQIPATNINAKKLSLYQDNRGELLFFNEASGAIYQLFQKDEIRHLEQDKVSVQQSGVGGVALFFILVSGLLSSYIFYQVKVQKRTAKSLIRREYSGIKLTDDTLALNLFRRHQKKAETVLELVDVVQCQVLIGDSTIATLGSSSTKGFNDQQEQELRALFHNEQVLKMVDGKVRRISLIINTRDKNNYIDSYVICLYMRRGSDRLTKQSYFEVVDDVIDWCWYFSEQFNSEQTGQRIFKPKLTADDIARADHKTHDVTPLHAQAAKVRPTVQLQHAKQETLNPEELGPEELSPEKQSSLEECDSDLKDVSHQETQLVYDLEKLIELKQQGFLTAKEFKQAKTALLQAQHLNNPDKTDDS
ncbi:hypothetical protein [Colwellia echini]|uniref:SHOCT domain-containing protein n=1 Tax=Colwellia echini TaxID=1982103 RepID=A0ABY3MZN4_9GAMM|nr:hypothetical protein [Colwellia echini]TYK66691.1 hypothetical protein CWS31_004990 [Colwellia echini]